MGGNPFTSFPSVVAGAVGGWVELDRTTLGSSNPTVDVTGLSNKRYLKFLWHTVDKPSARETRMRVGNGSFDSANNYATRRSVNGGADATNVSTDGMRINNNALNEDDWGVGYISNLAGEEKLSISWMEETAIGAGSIPSRQETVDKWANTSVSIDQLQLLLNSTGSFGTGTELVILGWDPADVHTTNFWEELASESGDGSSLTLSATIPARKYLWVQYYSEENSNVILQFNSDTGNNYARRGSINGATDFIVMNTNGDFPTPGADASFVNFFALNIATREKLVIGSSIGNNAAGAANATTRKEFTPKWTNTVDSITDISFIKTGSNYTSSAKLKVWGHD